MDIIDTQVHIGRGEVERAVAAMDALGITGMLVDEYWMGTLRDPGYGLPGGAFRALQPTAELGALLHPGRFSYLMRIDRNDPEFRALIRVARDTPHARALRITPRMWKPEADAFAAGDYDAFCAEAADCGLPVFIFAPDLLEHVGVYAQRFPSLRFILDHCGMLGNGFRQMLEPGAPKADHAALLAEFGQVLALAKYRNIALKWAHAPAMFETSVFPPEGLTRILRLALDAYGAERVMWASDHSANRTGESWAQLLFAVLGNAGLSMAEQAAVLGKTARTWLDWPA